MVKFSAVIATKGRATELDKLLSSLAKQSREVFEIVIVDQNIDDRVKSIINDYEKLPITHFHKPDLVGVNASRNFGWQRCKGDVIFFPDDDCWYPDDTLKKVALILEETGSDIVSGRAADETGRSINGRFKSRRCRVDRSSAWFTQIEWMFFCRKEVLKKTNGFDENIGPGAKTRWAANEVQDLSLSAMALGCSQSYDPSLYGHHAEIDTSDLDRNGLLKASGYALGFGHVLAKHNYPFHTAIMWSVRPIMTFMKAILVGNLRHARYALINARGRLQGYLETVVDSKAEKS